ncbi:hypothetical protein JW916_06525 [Candidatus Sumerlaeota bacterium]|nr:hypothetical protein [Candidatus Sumerlaeota bacterium]
MNGGNEIVVWVSEEHEVVSLLLCIGVLLFLLGNRAVLRRLPHPWLLMAGPVLLSIGHAAVVFGYFGLGADACAYIARASCVAGVVLAVWWVWKVRFRRGETVL